MYSEGVETNFSDLQCSVFRHADITLLALVRFNAVLYPEQLIEEVLCHCELCTGFDAVGEFVRIWCS